MTRHSDCSDASKNTQGNALGDTPPRCLAPPVEQFSSRLWSSLAIAGALFAVGTTALWAGFALVQLAVVIASPGSQPVRLPNAIDFAVCSLMGLPASVGLGYLFTGIAAATAIALVQITKGLRQATGFKDRSASAAGVLTGFLLAAPFLLAVSGPSNPSSWHARGLATIALGHLVVACPFLQLAGLLAARRDLRRRFNGRSSTPSLRFGVRDLLVTTALLSIAQAVARMAGLLTLGLGIGVGVWVLLGLAGHFVITTTLNSRAKRRFARRRRLRRAARFT